MRASWLGVLLLVTACAAETSLDGELLADGYIRYVAPDVPLAAGETAQYVHWVSNPTDRVLDLVDIRGEQGPGGHHAILFSSPDVEPIGTSRVWAAADQISARFLGGVGGEGIGTGVGLPPNAVFRIPARSAFYIQTHYFNASDEPITGTSSLEVKFADPSPDVTVLSMFVNTSLAIDVPSGASEQTINCVMQEDTSLIMYVNHAHAAGAALSTELRVPGSAVQMLKDDPAWNYEWATAPNFEVTALDKPLMIPAGSTLVTRCQWDNKTDRTLKFPDEMCAFLTFYVGTRDRACANGEWIEL